MGSRCVLACVGAGTMLASITLWSGCNIIGPLAAVAAGPPTVEAEHKLADLPTVVYVDDRRNVLPRRGLRRYIAEQVSEILMVKDLVTVTRPPREALALTGGEEAGDLMSIEEIGRSVGADQVIYVEMLSFKLTPDGFTPRPQASCTVRVTDITKRQRLYPADPNGRILAFESAREASLDSYRTSATRRELEDRFADETAVRIAQLFYKHEVGTELGQRMAPR